MKRFILLSLTLFCLKYSHAQDSATASVTMMQDSATVHVNEESLVKNKGRVVYTTKFKTDGPIIIAGVGLTYLGVTLIQNKKPLTAAQVAAKSKSDLPFFDRNSAGWYSKQANDDSYTPFYISFAAPLAMVLISKNERTKAGQVLVMYTETMAIAGTLFTMAAGLVQRSRPLVYGNKASMDLRMSEKSQRSFFAGHTSSSAAATFFAAKVFQDLNPDSKAKPYVWVIAAAIPASVGYLRYKAGMHFLSDNVLGYAIGAATGILVPQFHKNKKLKANFSLSPAVGNDYQGFSLAYHF
ncbi:MAG: phosphatase PAP2 family protein [Ginsengibacter sp.]